MNDDLYVQKTKKSLPGFSIYFFKRLYLFAKSKAGGEAYGRGFKIYFTYNI